MLLDITRMAMAKIVTISTPLPRPLLCITASFSVRSVGVNRVCLLGRRVNFSNRVVSGNIFVRSYTSSPSDDSDDTTLWRRFVNTVKLMAKGSKLIVTDLKKMLEIRRAAVDSGFYLLSGKAPKRRNVTITRAELSFVIQVFDCSVTIHCVFLLLG